MLGTDLKYTVRSLARQKLSTGLVVSMLTLAIAANVVVFGLVNGLFLRPFPFPEPDRLVYINETAPRWNLEVVGVNFPDFVQWRQAAKLFEHIALYDEESFNLSDGAGAERIEGARVTYDFAAVLGVQPVLGRTFTPEEDRPKAERVVVINEGVWRERFHAAPDVLGRTLKLNGVAHTIVGVMPAAIRFPGNVRLWVPMAGDPAQQYQSYFASAIGRLKAGVQVEDGEKDLLRAHQPIWDARDKDHTVSPYARPLREDLARDFRTQARTLLGAVAHPPRRGLRQRRERHARAGACPAAGDGHPARGRRQPNAPGPPTVRRERRPRRARWRGRPGARPLGTPRPDYDSRRSDPVRGQTSISTCASAPSPSS